MTHDGTLHRRSTTVGGFDRDGRLWVIGVLGAGGLGLGALVPVVARWLEDAPWVPFEGPLRLLSSFDASWLTWGRPAIGLALGVVAAAWVISASAVLEIDAEEVQVRRHGRVERVLARPTVAGVHPRGAKIVLESELGRTLFADDVEGDRAAVRRAFVEHGYPWEGPRD
ncbi:YqeB family protein [Cellulomonas sp. NPDC055163]